MIIWVCLKRVPLHSLFYHHFPIKCTVGMFKHLSFDLVPPAGTYSTHLGTSTKQYFDYQIPTLTGLREPIFNFSQVLLDKCA